MSDSERRSLMDGDILRREATARDVFDKFLTKLVDAFDFQIQEVEHQAAARHSIQQQQQQGEQRRQQARSPATRVATGAERNLYIDIRTPDVVVSPQASPSSRTTVGVQDPVGDRRTMNSVFMRRLSEKLTEFVLNESLDQAASENPMELGWRTRMSLPGAPTRSSLLEELRGLRHRASLPSDFGWRYREDDDAHFQTDDESTGDGNYQIMT